MELRESKRKRVGPHIKPQQPLPILIESESGIHAGNELWPLYIGTFTGDSVVLSNPDEIISLYTMGFFGKGSFSRGYPSFGLTKKGIPPVIKERQWQRRKTWLEKIKKNLENTLKSQILDVTNNSDNASSEDKTEKNKQDKQIVVNEMEPVDGNTELKGHDVPSSDRNDQSVNHFIDNNCDKPEIINFVSGQLNFFNSGNTGVSISDLNSEILVLADSDDEDMESVIKDPRAHLENDQIKTAVETLNLTLEEAFFLSYALGCLQVIDISGQSMTLKQLWKTCCEVKSDFIESYVVYHNFRAKGWVVKSGYKFGGDFLLYKQGPPFYHASYIVLVERVDSQLRRHKSPLSWTKLHGLNRLAESSGKDIITCQVVFPSSLTTEDLLSPKSLPRYQVNELITRRWISSQQRGEKEQD